MKENYKLGIAILLLLIITTTSASAITEIGDNITVANNVTAQNFLGNLGWTYLLGIPSDFPNSTIASYNGNFPNSTVASKEASWDSKTTLANVNTSALLQSISQVSGLQGLFNFLNNTDSQLQANDTAINGSIAALRANDTSINGSIAALRNNDTAINGSIAELRTNDTEDRSYINNTFPGSTAITTLGTITTGTWQGTPIAAAYISDPNYRTLVTLTSDVASTASTAFQNVTGLSFSVTTGTTYRFKATIIYTASATTVGSRWAVSGPASPTLLAYNSNMALTTTTNSIINAAAYDTGTASATSASTAGNIATVEGIIKPSASGTLIIRFAPDAATASGIVVKAGSTLEWW